MTIVEQMIYRGCKLLCNCHWQKTTAAAVGNIGIPGMIHLDSVMKKTLEDLFTDTYKQSCKDMKKNSAVL